MSRPWRLPASAWSQDRPKITDPGADLGTSWGGFGAPLTNVFHVHVSTTVETTPGVFAIVGTAIEDI